MESPPPDDTFSGNYDATTVIITICSALSLYNALELSLLIFTTFKEFRGLYFWSLLTATFGIIPYCVGLLIEYFKLTYNALGKAIEGPGWMMMITGQSFVLYSRLNLLLNNDRILKTVKWMIITNAIIFHTTTEILYFCGSFGPRQPSCSRGYFYIEFIQMTVFCLQEFIISGLYIWQTINLLKVISKSGTRRVMWQLFFINVVIIIMDIGLLVVEYKKWHRREQTIKSFVYSVKLKLEFAILSKLVEMVEESKRNLSTALTDPETFVDQTKTASGAMVSGSRPQWMSEVEKSNVELSQMHVELARTQSDEGQTQDDIEPLPPRRDHALVDTRQREWPALDLTYAEVMRSISRP